MTVGATRFFPSCHSSLAEMVTMRSRQLFFFASNNNMCLRCEIRGNPRWQSNEMSPKTRVDPIGLPAKETHSNKHASPVRNYR
jgi:hypothetical protein